MKYVSITNAQKISTDPNWDGTVTEQNKYSQSNCFLEGAIFILTYLIIYVFKYLI